MTPARIAAWSITTLILGPAASLAIGASALALRSAWRGFKNDFQRFANAS